MRTTLHDDNTADTRIDQIRICHFCTVDTDRLSGCLKDGFYGASCAKGRRKDVFHSNFSMTGSECLIRAKRVSN